MSKPSKAPPKEEPAVEQPKVSPYPSASMLELGDHFPKAIDLRPYHPHFESAGPTSAAAGAIAAASTRTGKPLPFVPSPEHLAAIGGHKGINKFGVRANGVKMGNPPTEYDLTADAHPINVTVYALDGVDVRAAFAAGHAVRIGDAFLVAYRTDAEGLTTYVASNGSEFVESTIEGGNVHVWRIEPS